MDARPAPLRPPPPLRCGSPAADPAWRRPLAGSAGPSGGRAQASPHQLVHHPRPARVALPARAASTSCSTAVAPRRRWRGSSPFSKAELVSSAQVGAREASARAGFEATPRASFGGPARHALRSTLSSLGSTLKSARAPTAPAAVGSWRTGSLLPALRRGLPALGSRPGRAGLWGARGPGPRARPPPSLRALCVRAAKLLEEPPCSAAACGGMIRGLSGD